MEKERKIYSRYVFNRGLQTLWKGAAGKTGSQFRSIAITSDEFNSTRGIFQVLALEGFGEGIQDGKFSGSKDDPKVLFDNVFRGLDEAGKKFDELVAAASARHLRKLPSWTSLTSKKRPGNRKDNRLHGPNRSSFLLR